MRGICLIFLYGGRLHCSRKRIDETKFLPCVSEHSQIEEENAFAISADTLWNNSQKLNQSKDYGY